MIHLSQGHLNLFSNCPPKFQQIYLEQLHNPLNPEQQLKQDWGSRFHLLMQQRELGLPIASLLENDAELAQCFRALIAEKPELFINNSNNFREAEHCRTLQFNDNYLFTVIYDLLITQENQARIIDWKTYQKPVKREILAKNWQTKLYLYVLAETSSYLPEQITMTYWFVRLPDKPQCLEFNYTQKQHEQIKQELTNILGNLQESLDNYWQYNQPFQHLGNTQENCDLCQQILNNSQNKGYLNQDWQNFLATIPEISI